MRSATVELKTCLTRLLGKYTISPDDHLDEHFRLSELRIIRPDTVYIKLKKRTMDTLAFERN